MFSFDLVNELTKEVDRYFKQVGKEREGIYHIPKEDFFQAINYIHNKGNKKEFHFLNKRLNQKFYQVYLSLADLTSQESLYQTTIAYLLDYFKDRDYIKINYLDYKKRKDDISTCVFLIDKEIKHKVLLDSGLKYDREDNEYKSQYGKLISLDDIDKGTGLSNHELIEGKAVENTDEELIYLDEVDYKRLSAFIDTLKLTKRQREIANALVLNGGNRTHTADDLGINVRNVRKAVSRIKQRIGVNFGFKSMTDYKIANKPIRLFEDLLNIDNKNYETIFDFIVEHTKDEKNSDEDMINILYEMDIGYRKPFIQHLNGKKEFTKTEKIKFTYKFIHTYNSLYYKH